MSQSIFAARLLALVLSTAAYSLSLPEAQRLLIQRNHDVAAIHQQTIAAQARVSEAKAAWFPALTAIAGYMYQTSPQKIDLPINPQLGTIQRTLGDNDRIDFGADLSYQLFTGFSRRYTSRSLQHAYESQQLAEAAVIRSLSYQLGLAYFAWELAAKRIGVQQVLIDQLTERVREARDRFQLGVVTRSRVSEIEARLAQANSDLVAAQGTADSLKAELAYILGTADTSMLPEPYQVPAAWTDAAALSRPIEQAPEVASAERNIELLELQRKALGAKRLPGVGATVSYRYANPGINLGAADFMSYGIAGASVSWLLFDGRKTAAQQRQLTAARSGAEAEREKRVALLVRSRMQAELRLSAAQQQAEAAKAALKASEQLVDDLLSAVEAGASTNAEYLDALVRAAQARLVAEQAAITIKIAYLSRAFASGQELKF